MKFGTYMFEAKKVPGFDFDLFRTKPEVGRRLPPKADMYSNVAIFGDNVAARLHPDWISQSDLGPAWRTNDNFNVRWEVLCATQPEHRAEQLDYMEDVARKSQGVWLNSIHFAEHGHCTCPRCKELHAKSGLSWYEWRRKEVTEYMAATSDRVINRAKKPLYIGILPDPVTNYERFGVNFDDMLPLTTEMFVVMFSKNYATPWYWEMLTRNFKKLFKDTKLNIALYVIGPGDDPRETPTASELLTVSVRMARAGVDGLLYLTDKAYQMQEFQKKAIAEKDTRERLKSYGGKAGQEVLDLVTSWEKLF
ncbi:MAG: hypothetical protein NWE93_13415 [Candidatus Bathyarchaeota archaeon]|nr:hypothetical protein [Candidatus Bathyarchaeota archaeon]